MSKRASAYVPEDQYERWRRRADEMDMTMSEWLASMVIAGKKKFDRDIEPDQTRAELKGQVADLLEELNHVRERNQKLEDQVYRGERQTIIEFIEENPAAEYHEVLAHVQQTAGERLTNHLDFLAIEEEIERNREGQYFVVDDADNGEEEDESEEVDE